MAFFPLLGTGLGLTHRILCHVDAQGSLAGLRRRPRSDGLQYILHEMRQQPTMTAALPHLRATHLYGVGNMLGDWASRGRLQQLEGEIKRRGLRSRQVAPPVAFTELLHRVAEYYKAP